MFVEDQNSKQPSDFWESSYVSLDNSWAGDEACSPVTSFGSPPTKKTYKHVPHRERPAVVVARRNARERHRVQAVNGAFNQLRKMLPIVSNRGKRVSKVKTLQIAIDYINALVQLLRETDICNHSDIVLNYRYQSNEFTNILEEFNF